MFRTRLSLDQGSQTVTRVNVAHRAKMFFKFLFLIMLFYLTNFVLLYFLKVIVANVTLVYVIVTRDNFCYLT